LKLFFYFLIFFLVVFSEEAKSSYNFGINAGMIYGGPVPEKFLDNIEVSPLLLPKIGIFIETQLTEKFLVHSSLNLSLKGSNFTAYYKRDTIVETEIDGTTGLVPTFYNAYINGEILMLYLDIPVYLTYCISEKWNLLFGIQPSFLASGKNDVQARVVVGEGGFYDDIKKQFDNFGFIKKFDFGFCLGSSYQFKENFSIEISVSRSIIAFYKDEFQVEKDIDVGKMYNTYISAMILYFF